MKMIPVALLALVVGGSAQAHVVKRHAVVQQPPQAVYVQPEPLRQIPIVGTVVYGGLNYAGQLIVSPFELIAGPPRRY